jgi:hypothetical protein
VFDSAFLAAIRELSRQGLPRAAQIAGQVAVIEAEHRALGRAIAARKGIATLPNPVGALIEGRLNPRPSNPEPNPVPTTPPNTGRLLRCSWSPSATRRRWSSGRAS